MTPPEIPTAPLVSKEEPVRRVIVNALLLNRETNAASIVARDICRQIVEGALREGQSLPSESELLATYRVSREVLREALRLLEWDSFVMIRRGAAGGAVVTLPDVRIASRYCGLLLQAGGTTLDDLDDSLQALEPEIVRTIATQGDADFIVLERALAVEAEAHQTAPAFLAAGSHFHELLPRALRNEALHILLGIPREIRARHNLAALKGLTEKTAYHQKTFSTHRDALELMRARQGDQAGSLWARHLATTSRALRDRSSTTVLDLFNRRAADFDLTSASPNGLRRMRIPKGADILASELRSSIVTGAIGEGEPVPTERALMERYGFSRPPVREALRVLEAEHLVQRTRGAHSGGRARRPNIETATWQTGLLMQRSGCTIQDLAAAQMLLERCASRTLTDPATGATMLADVRGTSDQRAAHRGNGTAILDTFDVLGRHISNRTLASLTAICRSLLRHAVELRNLRAYAFTPGPALASLDAAIRAGRPIDNVREAWESASDHFYRQISQMSFAEERIDMFQ